MTPLDGLVTCAGPTYATLLSQTLPVWSRILDRVFVVCPTGDREVVSLCSGYPNAHVVETEAFRAGGAIFNKGAALNEGYRHMSSGGNIVQFDADVLPPDLCRRVIDREVKAGNVYGAKRVDKDRHLGSVDRNAGVYGFFMAWSARDPVLVGDASPFSERFPHAGGYDFEFRDRWLISNQVVLPLTVSHLGTPYRNWYGSELPWVSKEESDIRMKALKGTRYRTDPADLLPEREYGDVRDLLRDLPHQSNIYGANTWVRDANLYPVYAKLFAALRVESLHEIGALLGYSLIAAASVPSLRRVSWVDNESSLPKSNAKAEENLRVACKKIGRTPPLAIRHSRHHDFDPREVDAVHLDGMHDEKSVLADLRRALALKPRYILGHDADLRVPDSKWFQVRKALDRFCAEERLSYLLVDLTSGCFVVPLSVPMAECRRMLADASVPLQPKQSWVHVDSPRPIPLPLPPRRDKCICVMSWGADCDEMWAVSRPSVERYADRVGADLVVIDDSQFPEFPLADKFRVRSLLGSYERVLFLDADVIVGRRCPDVFAEIPPTLMAMRSDLEGLTLRNGKLIAWFDRDLRALRASQGVGDSGKLGAYYNTGVILFSRDHAGAFDPPPLPLPTAWCNEQNAINDNLARLGIPVRPFGPSEVYEWWLENEAPGLEGKPTPQVVQTSRMDKAWFLHFAGMGHTPEGKLERLRLMKVWAERNL